MLKKILDLNGAQELSKQQQLSINGGVPPKCVDSNIDCKTGGNAVCPIRQGCLAVFDDPPTTIISARCVCL